VGENSKIEWTDHTFNPWLGCTKVGPPCDNCYAEAWAMRWGQVTWGPHGERKRTSAANWRKPYQWNEVAKANKTRARVFCASLADWLDNQVSDNWRDDLAEVIDGTSWLDWLLLTKRIQNFDKHAPWHDNDIPANVWLGITCGDRIEYERDWPRLCKLRATVRFISYEPALAPLYTAFAWELDERPDWIICGGESGSNRRMMNPQWARDVRDACRRHGIAFFMKQMTGKEPIPPDLLVRQFPQTSMAVKSSKNN
jgi:protein gp37